MGRITARLALFISVLLLMVGFATSCRDANSGPSDTGTKVVAEHLQQLTLRLTGLS